MTRTRVIAYVTCVALAGLAAGVRSTAGAQRGRRVAELPNIVYILTDDQRSDETWAFPKLQADLVDHGISFANMFVVNSLCCPSRVSIITGEYSHTSKVYTNGGAYGGFGSFHGDASTVATWLHGAGYRTGLIGKYLNGYQSRYVPPGWDVWSAFFDARGGGGAYYGYDLYHQDGSLEHHGFDVRDYSTDVLTAQADSFIRQAPGGQPFFLYFAPFADHVPSTPAPKYANAFGDLQKFRPPNYNEADVSDKPAWVQALRPMTPDKQRITDEHRKNVFRTLLSVDDAVGAIVAALKDTQRLANTMIVFTSDNGSLLGEHRWTNKQVAYEEGIRVPLIIRFDPLITSPRTDDHIVTNLDFAPTFAELAGVGAPGVDGMSLMPLIKGSAAPWRTEFLVEHLESESDKPPVPTYCAVRNELYAYTRYLTTGEEELYDLSIDPYELNNKVTNPRYAWVLRYMRARESALCNPPPP